MNFQSLLTRSNSAAGEQKLPGPMRQAVEPILQADAAAPQVASRIPKISSCEEPSTKMIAMSEGPSRNVPSATRPEADNNNLQLTTRKQSMRAKS